MAILGKKQKIRMEKKKKLEAHLMLLMLFSGPAKEGEEQDLDRRDKKVPCIYQQPKSA